MTPEDLVAGERLLADATAGEWRLGWFDGPGRILVETGPEDEPVWINEGTSAADANLIVWAKNNLAELIALARTALDREQLVSHLLETDEDLEAQPVGTIILTEQGGLFERVRVGFDRHYWGEVNTAVRMASRHIALPAQVLYREEGM